MSRVPSPAKVMSVRVFWALSCLFFGAALALPLISITPGVGELTHWLRLLKPDAMATVTQTMFSSIHHLCREFCHPDQFLGYKVHGDGGT